MESNTEKKREELKNALESSSAHNRGLMFLFTSFAIFIFVTAVTTTDLQLLTPASKVKLPIINLELTLFGFYLLSPLLLLIFHSYFLFNLIQHGLKLYGWNNLASKNDFLVLPPFIFNYLIRYEKGHINYFFLRIIIWLVIYFMPLCILIYIQWRFSSYHNLFMTLWHFFIVLSDVLLLASFWQKAVGPIHSENAFNNSKKSAEKSLTSRFINHFISMKKPHAIKDLFGNLGKASNSIIETGAVWLVVAFSLFNASVTVSILCLPWEKISLLSQKYRFPIPHIKVTEKTLMSSFPGDEIIQRYLAMNKTKQDALVDFGEGLDLRDRDLKFADLSKSDLIKADLRGAQLQGANLYRAALIKADLSDASLRDTNFKMALLNKADLKKADLGGASLYRANMKGCSLNGSDCTDANFIQARLQGASLKKTLLYGANFDGARLQGAVLSGSQLQGSNFSNVQLQGVYANKADFQGSNFKHGNLQGAYLHSSNFQGAYFLMTKLQGAVLRFADLHAVYMSQAQLKGVITKASDTKVSSSYIFHNRWEEEASWKEMLQNTANEIPESENSRGLFVERITKAQNTKKEANTISMNVLAEQVDLENFIEARQKLACGSKNIFSVKGMINQYRINGIFNYHTTQQIKKAVLAYMEKNCPEILQEIERFD